MKMKQSTREFIYGILWLIASFFMSMIAAWIPENTKGNSYDVVIFLWVTVAAIVFLSYGAVYIGKASTSREYGN